MQATGSECKLSSTSAPSGTLTFAVTNGGTKVTEFYLYGEDGKRIIGEVENVGPGITRELVLKVEPGSYITACKPGIAGDGLRAPFSVSDSGQEQGSAGNNVELVEQANQNYQKYVEDQSEQLVSMTAKFVAAYKAGKDDEVRAIYPVARMHWERIETVAESFGDLDRSSTCGRLTLSLVRSGPAGIGSRRTCGQHAPRTIGRSVIRSVPRIPPIW